MASTFSTDLRIELIGSGEQAGTWGTTTNTNLGTLIEQAIAGVGSVSLTNLTSYTLTALNGASDQARNAVLIFTGALSANCNVIAPSVQKLYVISNQTTGGYAVNIKTSSGSVYPILSTANQFIYCDGTNFYGAVGINTVNGNLIVSGNISAGGSLTAGTVFNTPEINENVTVTGTGAGATINFYTQSQTILFYNGYATTNSTVNITGNGSTTLNSLMAVGQSTCVTLFYTNSAPAYYPNVIKVDGTTVTPLWQGGVAPTGGNTNSVDVYSFNIIKTGSAAFTVFASQSPFA